VPVRGVVHGGSEPGYKAEAEILGGTEGVGAGHSTEECQDNRTWQGGKTPHFGGAHDDRGGQACGEGRQM